MNIFEDFDFKLLDDPDFKEDSVREELILPLLKALGYKAKGGNKIIRSKSLNHPFVKTGSKKRPVNSIPDYLLEINKTYKWVLDAKAPDEEIKTGEHREQCYFYAIHPDIHVKYYSLCNGREFILFQINLDKPLLYFHLSEINQNWQDLSNYLLPSSLINENSSEKPYLADNKIEFDYMAKKLLKEIPVRKRAAKRHFGVHGYFTKQSWNVVNEYIKNFSKKGDLVLDPFGGSGVTAIEAMMLNRKAVNIDINPLAIFIVESLVTPVNFSQIADIFNNIIEEYNINEDDLLSGKKKIKNLPKPKDLLLPKDSDVDTVSKLFSEKQLIQLGYLKYLILKVKDKDIRKSLLLMFSGLITKINLTYHTSKVATKDGQGDASAFRYYRYRIAPIPKDIDIIKYFSLRFKKVIDAKKEMQFFINNDTINYLKNIQASATDLNFIQDESVDYIYTDPPYGSKINYLDLSIMWNAWLDLEVTEKDYELEAIEGGEYQKSSEEYMSLLEQSLKEMFRVLKFERWMSFVFAHQDPKFWHFIVDTAEAIGFEYAGAVKQSNGQTSFKKRQNPFSVLSGQLIINFKKVKNPKTIQKVQLGVQIYDLVIETIESVIAKNEGASLEEINDELIIRGLELGFLDILSKEYKDLTPILLEHFEYEKKSEKFHIIKNQKFKTNIPVDLRIRYFLISYLKRQQLENKNPTTDEIILNIMPLLKNGKTPENQTILSVLSSIATKVEKDKWKLKSSDKQFDLF